MINWFWLQFAAICIVGAMSPGPSMALIIRNSIKFGRVSGLLSSIGHAIGIGIYAAISIAGLQLILISNIIIFNTIQLCGSIFLLILGILFLKNSGESLSIEDDQKEFKFIFSRICNFYFKPKNSYLVRCYFFSIYRSFINKFDKIYDGFYCIFY